jgi:hypothetical protein
MSTVLKINLNSPPQSRNSKSIKVITVSPQQDDMSGCSQCSQSGGQVLPAGSYIIQQAPQTQPQMKVITVGTNDSGGSSNARDSSNQDFIDLVTKVMGLGLIGLIGYLVIQAIKGVGPIRSLEEAGEGLSKSTDRVMNWINEESGSSLKVLPAKNEEIQLRMSQEHPFLSLTVGTKKQIKQLLEEKNYPKDKIAQLLKLIENDQNSRPLQENEQAPAKDAFYTLVILKQKSDQAVNQHALVFGTEGELLEALNKPQEADRMAITKLRERIQTVLDDEIDFTGEDKKQAPKFLNGSQLTELISFLTDDQKTKGKIPYNELHSSKQKAEREALTVSFFKALNTDPLNLSEASSSGN